jgi:hypothetical protein
MPYENLEDSSVEFADQLSILENLIYNNSDCHVIIGGDFNVDFSRDRIHTAMLSSFCTTLSLNPAVHHVKSSVDYTYNFNMSRFNVLDHFLLSSTVFAKSLLNNYVIHDVDNLSDHEPIMLQLHLEVKILGFCEKVHKPHVSWAKANEHELRNYRSALAQNLYRINLPIEALLCNNLMCDNVDHVHSINTFAMDISEACIVAADESLPHTCVKAANGRIPGWSSRVQLLREKSMFWHRMWIDCDRPRNGTLADVMRRTRAAYHYAIRQTRKEEDAIIRDRIAASLIEDGKRNFWQEIKHLRSAKAGTSRIVDGIAVAKDIAQLFAAHYQELYTSVPYNSKEMQDILNTINGSLAGLSVSEDCIFSTREVEDAVSRLKVHKNEGASELSTDHIINANHECFSLISSLFTAITVHGNVPDVFRRSTIVPIPKGHNVNKSDSTNYRGIALSSVFGKILDNIILNRYQVQLMSCDRQFGFKPKSSTNLCTMILKETIAYYVENQSPVFCTFLDASKAFDKVNYCKLFNLLLKRDLPVLIIRILANMYTSNFVCISWGGTTTDYFSVINGVKQGAVLSPVLYCVYIDDLLLLLSRAGVGCYIGQHFVGALAYADDLVIIAPTASALRRLLVLCESYAREYCISFNALKSKCLTVVPKNCRAIFEDINHCVFYIDGKPIEFVRSFSHLGHMISSELNDDEDIINRKTAFIGQVNNTLCYFDKLTSLVKFKLFQSYCTSYYGCELWSLSNKYIDDFCTTWRKSLRRVWGLPLQTHGVLLPALSQCLPIMDEICRRSLNFIRSCIQHENTLIRFIAVHGVCHGRSRSPLGENVLMCANRYNCSVNDLLYGRLWHIINSYVFNLTNGAIHDRASFLSELIFIRDNSFSLSGGMRLSHDELQDIIIHVCTSQLAI